MLFGKFIPKKRLEAIFEKRPCSLCKKYKTMNCPNHGKCLEVEGKPYFELNVKKL